VHSACRLRLALRSARPIPDSSQQRPEDRGPLVHPLLCIVSQLNYGVLFEELSAAPATIRRARLKHIRYGEIHVRVHDVETGGGAGVELGVSP